jgi:hypothetical protein
MDKGPSPGISKNMEIIKEKYDREYYKNMFLGPGSGPRGEKCNNNMKNMNKM